MGGVGRIAAPSHEVRHDLSRLQRAKRAADVSPLEKSQSLFKQLHTLDEALSWARHLERTDRIPLLIEGDDGTRMDRRAIVDALRVGMREDVDGSARA
jgi:hypothetical protein